MWKTYTRTAPPPAEAFLAGYALLAASLPENELRTREGQRALLQSPAYRLRLHYNEAGGVDAFFAVWEWEALRFGEHLAVSPALRSKGLGGSAITAYLNEDARPFVLEVEPAGSTPMAARRIAFYERLGLHLLPYPYEQPPLRAGAAPLRLMLMSWPAPLPPAGFEAAHALLYREVYGFQPGAAVV